MDKEAAVEQVQCMPRLSCGLLEGGEDASTAQAGLPMPLMRASTPSSSDSGWSSHSQDGHLAAAWQGPPISLHIGAENGAPQQWALQSAGQLQSSFAALPLPPAQQAQGLYAGASSSSLSYYEGQSSLMQTSLLRGGIKKSSAACAPMASAAPAAAWAPADAAAADAVAAALAQRWPTLSTPDALKQWQQQQRALGVWGEQRLEARPGRQAAHLLITSAKQRRTRARGTEECPSPIVPEKTRHWSHADHLYSRHHQQQQRWPAEGGAQPVNAAALGAAANGAARGALPVGGTPSQGAIIYGAVGQQDLAFADWFATHGDGFWQQHDPEAFQQLPFPLSACSNTPLVRAVKRARWVQQQHGQQQGQAAAGAAPAAAARL